MFIVVQGYLVVFLEMICCKLFFKTFCSQKKSGSLNINVLEMKVKWRELILLCGLGFSTGTVVVIWDEYFFLKEISLIILVTMGMKLYFGCSIKKSFILTIIYQSLLLLFDYVAIVLGTTVLGKEKIQSVMVQSLMTVLSKGILFLGIIFIYKILHEGKMECLDDAIWLKFLFFPLFSICVLIALVFNVNMIVNEKQEHMFWLFAFGLVGMNIMVFYLLQDIAGRERELQEKRIYEREARNQLKLYKSISDNIETQRAKTHEYQNQMACIQTLFSKKEYKKLGQYLEKVNGETLSTLDYINTNHIIVNAILNQKYQEALQKNISVVCKINDLSAIQMEDQDIVLLLSNLLNNAITACAKCTGQKLMKLKFFHNKEFVIFAVRNTYQGKIEYKDGMIQTIEEDKQNHGIGIKNMIRVIEKYGGSYVIEHKNGEFFFSIMIPQEFIE